MSAFGSHNGYAKNNHGLIHQRKFKMAGTFCKITDEISFLAPAEARFHLHPNVVVKQLGDSYGKIEIEDGELLHWSFSGTAKVEIKKSSWHPEFGISIPNCCIIAYFEGQDCEFTLKWT